MESSAREQSEELKRQDAAMRAAAKGKEGERGRLAIRVFSFRHRVIDRHSFLVGNDQGGVTDVMGHIDIDRGRTTLADVRTSLEVVREQKPGGMLKRNPLFAEVIYVMNANENLHGRPANERRQYRFAQIRPDDVDAPDPKLQRIFTLEEEEDIFAYPLQPCCVVVPLWLIGPKSGVPCVEDYDPEEGIAPTTPATRAGEGSEAGGEAQEGVAEPAALLPDLTGMARMQSPLATSPVTGLFESRGGTPDGSTGDAGYDDGMYGSRAGTPDEPPPPGLFAGRDTSSAAGSSVSGGLDSAFGGAGGALGRSAFDVDT